MTQRILHVITGLPRGGAQTMLYNLLARTNRSEIEPQVVSLLGRGTMAEPIERLGIRVRALGMTPGPSALARAFRLVRWLREQRVELVHSWMYHADLIGGLAARLAGIRGVIWGIRQSTIDERGTKRTTLWIARVCARLSGVIPARIVCCSEAARRGHSAFGYDAERMVVIPNGFDLSSFRPDATARISVRNELAIPEEAPIVGLVARLHPQKDHPTFLSAARRVLERHREVHFLLCGEGVTEANSALRSAVGSSPHAQRFHLLGERSDVSRLTAAFDVACSASFAEGFPNAVGEAMAAAVTCIVTDVGDSAELVGDTGRIVPPENPEALAVAISALLSAGPDERRRLGEAARRRVQERYSLPSVVQRYEALYREVLSQCAD